jgi:HAE1 family hydrophobic/amphiphilic exporter-1
VLSFFTNWITNLLKWCLDRYKTTLAVVLVFILLDSIALVPFGFIGGGFLPKSDGGEFSNRIAKDASLEQSNFMAQKAENFLNTQKYMKSLITKVGQILAKVWSASQSTAYKLM